MIFPWARVLISAGAHGLRRIPGQSVNLAHLIWRTPRAPAPLLSSNKVHPRWFSARGYGCWWENNKNAVIPEGVSLSGTSCRTILGGPRSTLSLRRG
jgi:hypothetical protein